MIDTNESSKYPSVMRDADIRRVLHQYLAEQHQNEPDTLFVDELGLCQGESRVDVAVINGQINGYEIKSECDTLNRLPIQKAIYGKTLDSVTIVASGNHLSDIMKIIPDWWGVIKVSSIDGDAKLEVIRESGQNPDIDWYEVAGLLWRDEALEELQQRGLDRGIKGKPRTILWKKLADSLPPAQISSIVRHRLKNRANWRVD